MNSSLGPLDARVRAAVRDTAAEIGPEDVPPMRAVRALAGRRRGGRLAGSARRAVAVRWGVPLAAAAAVVAVVTASGLIPGVLFSGTRPGGASTGATPGLGSTGAKPVVTAKPAASPGYPTDLQAGLIGTFVPATGAQFAQGAQFVGKEKSLESEVTARCMARAGYTVPVTTPAEFARTFWDLTQYPDLNAITRAGTMPGDGLPGVKPLSGSKAFQSAYLGCVKKSESLFRQTTKAGWNLGGPFLTTVTNIQSSAPVLATIPALRTCAAKYGWPHDPYGPDRPLNSFADFVTWVSGHLDGAGSRGTSNATMHQLDVYWSKVFVECGRPIVAEMEKLQLAAQRTYLVAHQAQLAALVAIARADFAHAARVAKG